MSRNDCALLVFAKAPVPGAVKTRLIPALGAEGAAALQQRLLDHTLRTAAGAGGCELQLWCSPDTAHPAFARAAREHRLSLRTQCGGDLGERMAHGMETVLKTRRRAIVIGTDCPALTAADLAACAEQLQAGCEAVIGPAADGGYYLLGLSRFEPVLFCDIDWGSDRVLAQTTARMERAGITYRKMETKHDLDRPEDLERFPKLGHW